MAESTSDARTPQVSPIRRGVDASLGQVPEQQNEGAVTPLNSRSPIPKVEIVTEVNQLSTDELATRVKAFREDIQDLQAIASSSDAPDKKGLTNRLDDTCAVLEMMEEETTFPDVASNVFFACCDGSKTVGLATTSISPFGEDLPCVHINQMVTRPGCSGIGPVLMTHFLNFSEAQNQGGTITVMPKNEIVEKHYSEKFGFQVLEDDPIYMVLRPSNAPEIWEKDGDGKWKYDFRPSDVT